MDDIEDDLKARKNLTAERKRREKLIDRLYALRALVPTISKLGKTTIIVDAIEYVKQLQKQAKDLQDELEENSDGDGAAVVSSESSSQKGMNLGPETEPNGYHLSNGLVLKQDQDSENTNEKGQHLELQVEVGLLDGNEFFVKVFCGHKPDGFVRLMEALDSLGLEVTKAKITRFRGRVSNIFKVEKRDGEMVQADHVRDLLLEITRNPA